MTEQLSFKNNPNAYMQMFLFNFCAFILVNTIFGNIFTGLITDAFGSHREKTQHFEDDKENLCYICDYSRTVASVQGVNFEEHQQKHDIKNYIKFIIYLFLKNHDDFTLPEKIVYDFILDNDISWMPYNGSEDN